MLLGANIGNTNTTLGFFHDDDPAPHATRRYATQKNATPDDLIRDIEAALAAYRAESGSTDAVGALACSSVVPELNAAYHAAARSLCSCDAFEVSHAIRLNVRLCYDDPSQLGADRIANAAAARREYASDCVIVDLGTAITFCVLRANGDFEGGLIAPGAGICIDALAERTSRLPRAEFRDPGTPIARNTADAVAAGVFYGWLSLVEGVVQRIERNCGTAFTTVLTGGYADIIAAHATLDARVDPHLTLKGIKLLYDLNRA
ncbi:MAG TPA: type III pantothenate kinase [Spirochaetota bacterium]|nr:type III pantothenate kinase [Spirochaetota bacterium]